MRQVARKDKDVRFTALLHHVDVARLRKAYAAIRREAAPGVDGVTWAEYGQDLEANLRDLHARVQQGKYRAKGRPRRNSVCGLRRVGWRDRVVPVAVEVVAGQG